VAKPARPAENRRLQGPSKVWDFERQGTHPQTRRPARGAGRVDGNLAYRRKVAALRHRADIVPALH